MKRRHVLTQKNIRKLYVGLKKYLNEILQDEEYINTMEKLKADVIRVKCYPVSPRLTNKKCSEYLRGLPISTEYVTYNIVDMLLSMVSLNIEDFNNGLYVEDAFDLDNFYWDCLGYIIYSYR